MAFVCSIVSADAVKYRLLNARFPLNFPSNGRIWTLDLRNVADVNQWRAQITADGETYVVETGYTETDLDRRLTVIGVLVAMDSPLAGFFAELENFGLAERVS